MLRFVAIPLLALSCVTVAEAATPATLITHPALRKRVVANDPSLRVIDARPRAEYDKSHIPGAVWVDFKAATALGARPNSLTDARSWSAWVTPFGIDEQTEVVVYDGEKQLEAARIWWLLKYVGVENVSLLDGNFGYWQSQGGPVSSDMVKVEPRVFPVKFRTDRGATRDEVLAVLESRAAKIIDARTEGEHTGTVARAKRGGRIPTACHLEWTEFVGPDGRFLDEAAQRAKIAKAGIKPGESVITHCQTGGRSSVNAFVFERLGFPTRNYYQGWSDWGNAESTPVAKGKPEGTPESKP